MAVRNHTDLVAWQKAMDLVVAVYTLTKRFPGDELYGLISQLKRAAVSVPSNIAEGQGRFSTGEFVHFLGIANGSLREVETQVHLAARLGLVDDDAIKPVLALAAEVGRLLYGLKNSLTK